MKIKNIILAAIAMLGMTACENDGFYFQDEASVRLVGDANWTLGTDSIQLSFNTISGSETKIAVDACVIGSVTNTDRKANITVVAAKTTAPSGLYEVPATVTIPAGQSKGTFYVTLKKNDTLKDMDVQLYIQLAPSADLAVGAVEQNHLLIRWNDKVSKPLYWDDIKEFFGEYSEEKYRFMLDVLVKKGLSTDLNPANGLNWADLHNLQIVFANALAEYNATNPKPLTDKSGNLISF